MDLISRQAAIETFTGMLHMGLDERDIVNAFEEMPSVDAVPVVRCEYCKHRDPKDKKCDCGHDIIWQLPRDDNWFCADGERRTDA